MEQNQRGVQEGGRLEVVPGCHIWMCGSCRTHGFNSEAFRSAMDVCHGVFLGG